MRKHIIFLSLVVILLSAFSMFTWSYYRSSASVIKEKTVCCTQPSNSETMFESLVKQLVGVAKL